MRWIATLLCLAACAVNVVRAQYDFTLVEQLLNDSLDVYHGNVAVEVYQHDSLIFDYQAGELTMDSVIGIASATKWISAAVVLTLVEDGYFALDDTIGLYLPVFTQYGKGHVTIGQCFSMTSGLVSEDAEELNPFYTLEQSVDSIAANVPIVFAPGTAIAYDGSGMQSVGRIAEVVTGLGWRLLANARVFAPCSMAETGYNRLGLNPAVAGGITCPGRDYMRFLDMLENNGEYDGEQVLEPQSVEQMFHYLGDLPIVSSPWLPESDYYAYGNDDPPYGFGSWQIAIRPDSNIVEEISSPGVNKTFPWLDRNRGLRAIIFTYLAAEEMPGQTVNVQVVDAIRDVIDCEAPITTSFAMTQSGPPNWTYSMTVTSGCLNQVVIRDFCEGTTATAPTGWTVSVTDDSIIYSSTEAYSANETITGFGLHHPTCDGDGRWGAGQSGGTIRGPLPVGSNAELPTEFALKVFPNPFNPQTTLHLAIPQASETRVLIFNITGQLVRDQDFGRLQAGYHSLRFDGADLPSGMYFARVQASSFHNVQKLMLLK